MWKVISKKSVFWYHRVTIGIALMGQVLGPVNYHFGAFDREYRSTYSILANSVLHKASASLWISERSGSFRARPLVASTGSEFSFRPSSWRAKLKRCFFHRIWEAAPQCAEWNVPVKCCQAAYSKSNTFYKHQQWVTVWEEEFRKENPWKISNIWGGSILVRELGKHFSWGEKNQNRVFRF